MNFWISGLLDLFFSENCANCKQTLTRKEYGICLPCLGKLPLTDFHQYKENPVFLELRNRIPIVAATSGFYFRKGNSIQTILHEIKYQKDWKAARILGRYYGSVLIENEIFRDIDLIIPIPLHPKRMDKRSFNQSEEFAIGLAELLPKPINSRTLIRIRNSESQSHKTKEQRSNILKNDFALLHPQSLKNQKILLVDDLMTTGATLEACGHLLFEASAEPLKIATLAYTLI